MALSIEDLQAVTDPLERAALATALIRQTERDVIAVALRIREQAVKECRLAGQSLRAIGNVVGLTPERVRKIAEQPDGD